MALTPVERAILMNQNLILAKLHPEEHGGYEERAEALMRGYEAEYDLGLSDQPPLTADVTERVNDVMTMFRHLSQAFDRYPELDAETKDDLLFHGYDGNNDREFGYLRFITGHGRWDDVVEGRPMDSHTQTSKPRYERMYITWEGIVGRAFYEHQLTLDELKTIATAALPPR